MFVADVHRAEGQRFVVHADEKLTTSGTRICDFRPVVY